MSGTNGKGKLAIYWAASCGGCEISILGIDTKILDVAKAFDIVFCPCIADGKVSDIEKMADGEIDVCLFNGGIRTSENEYMAQLLRKKSKVLVAFGSCATEGCIPGLGNLHNRQAIFDNTYQETFSTENPDHIRPQTETPVPEGTLHLPVFYETLKTLDQTVKVDYYLPGCPPESPKIWEALEAIVSGKLPPPGTVIGANTTVCDSCPRTRSEKEEDQGIQADLGSNPGRQDLSAGTGHPVLRHRHARRVRRLVPPGQLALHWLLRPERRRGGLRGAAAERLSVRDRLPGSRRD